MMNTLVQNHLLKLAKSLDRQPILQAITRYIADNGSSYVGDGKLAVCGMILPKSPIIDTTAQYQLSLSVHNSLTSKTWRMMIRCNEQNLEILTISTMREENTHAGDPKSFPAIITHMVDLFNV